MEFIKSVDPKLWGSPAWIFLDAVVSSYPDVYADVSNQDHNAALEEWVNRTYLFWKNLYLPCVACMSHYEKFLLENPVDEALCDEPSYREWYKKLKHEMTTTAGSSSSSSSSSSSPASSILHNVQPMPTQIHGIPPIAQSGRTGNHPQNIRRSIGYHHQQQQQQTVRAKNNKPCPCASRYSMTSMIKTSSANMGARRK